MDLLKIKPITDDDVQTIEAWLKKDHVRQWFENADAWLDEIKERDEKFNFVKHFVAFYDEKPFGFCQYYACSDVKAEWNTNYPIAGSYSLDYLIGEEEFLGRGLGKAVINLLIGEVFSLAAAERIVAKPDEGNKASQNALLSNGFVFDAENKTYCLLK